ncbi:MAG: Gfo/Idh/MocA family oxidoreductase [Chitinophagaceae bacterium]|nr:Gfo/Idh/MocA family oxidoreductase [Chitinophagaceae bacterium]
MNRRTFLKNTGIITASMGIPAIVPSSVFGKNAPSNRITIGLIGTGRQGYGQNLQGAALQNLGTRIPGMLDIPDARILAVCDVDRWRMNKAKETIETHYGKNTSSGKYKGCSTYTDFRDLINRKDIDAVMISTPDYWHTTMGIMAARTGKHISCEKPLSMSVQQGRSLVDAIKKYRVINRTDSEFRSIRPQNFAVECVRNGRIGALKKIEIVFPSDPLPVPPQLDMPVPKELNYDLWLGPAQYAPYTDQRVHTPFDVLKRPGWMRVDKYAQGMIANWGAHYFDMAQWANNSEYAGPVEVSGKGEFPRSLWNTMINFQVSFRYANGVEIVCEQSPASKPSIKYIGSEGWITVTGYPGIIAASSSLISDARAATGELDLSRTLWDKEDFIQAIKENRPTLEPIEVGHRTISLSQIGLIACITGGKLQWDPEKESFNGNNAANALLTAPVVRKEWIV